MLGAAAASVQVSRSVSASVGTASVGAVLAARDTQTAAVLAGLVQDDGPRAPEGLSATKQLVARAEIAGAFRAGFLTIRCFTLTGRLFAWWLQVRRIQRGRLVEACRNA